MSKFFKLLKELMDHGFDVSLKCNSKLKPNCYEVTIRKENDEAIVSSDYFISKREVETSDKHEVTFEFALQIMLRKLRSQEANMHFKNLSKEGKHEGN